MTSIEKMKRKFVVSESTGCWNWARSKDSCGYGRAFCKAVTKSRMAHRIMYELLVWKIPDGLTIDHLCRNRACVNPSHMEPVPLKENIRRGESPSSIHAKQTTCKRGHVFDDANTYIGKSRYQRVCMKCYVFMNESRRAKYAAAKGLAAASATV